MKDSVFVEILESFPTLRVELSGGEIYQYFRRLEPQLVSVVDKVNSEMKSEHEVIALHHKDTPVAMVSIVVSFNQYRKGDAKYYARVDLVVVEPGYRKLGIANALVLASLAYALETRGKELYSLSCLAGHPAIGVILEKLGFSKKRQEKLFSLYDLSLDGCEISALQRQFVADSKQAFHLCNYRIRQQVGK